ncbi:hypothetical protein MAP00_000917 [Monascus purpureus]|nr:hypothetical protein MAP00_000917 [Monascus purpureus]
MCDDESFTRAISGYRDAWLVQHSHLSESERNQLWSRRLSQFLPVSASPAGLHAGSPMRRSGKRFRQDIPRMLPPDSGFPSAKRQATTPEVPAPANLTRDLSHASSLAAWQLAHMPSQMGNSPSSIHGSSYRHTAMARSKSQQTPVSKQAQQGMPLTTKRKSYGPQRTQLRIDHVNEYSPSEYTQQCLDDPPDLTGTSLPFLGPSPDLVSTGQGQLQFSLTDFGGLSTSSPDGTLHPALAATAMSRSTTTDSLCGGIGMMRFDSTGSNLDPSTSSFTFPASNFVPSVSQDISIPVPIPSKQSDFPFPFSESCPPSFSTYAPPTTPFQLPLSSATEMGHSMSSSSSSSSLSQQSRATRRTQEQIVQGTRPIAPKVEGGVSTTSNVSDQHKMIRISSSNGTPKEVAAIPKASIQRPPRPKTYCTMCNDQPDGFHGEHELRRHIERVHSVVRKVWVCVDISPDKTFLANCKACRSQKRYGANYNAAAHLRRTHFNPCQRARGGRSKDSEKRGGKGGGNQPSMEVLKHWMVQIDEFVEENAPNLIDQGLGGQEAGLPQPAPVAADDAMMSNRSSDLGLASTIAEGGSLPTWDPSLVNRYDGFSSMDFSPLLDTSFYASTQQVPGEIDAYAL